MSFEGRGRHAAATAQSLALPLHQTPDGECHLQKARITELSFLMFQYPRKWLPTDVEDRLLSKRMMSYWVSFAEMVTQT